MVLGADKEMQNNILLSLNNCYLWTDSLTNC